MRLITLNVWGGKLFEPLIDFIRERSCDTDIFCFQDVLFGSEPAFSPIQHGRINLFREFQNMLSEFHSFEYRDPTESYFHGEMLNPDVGCGQVVFVQKNLEVVSHGGFRGNSESNYHKGGDIVSGRCQWMKMTHGNEQWVLMNLHGAWQRNSEKKDTPERIEQSEKIVDFFGNHEGKKILCGDFNIVKDGRAMAILETDMVNLIKKYDIRSTRSRYYPKAEQFADYILVSRDVEVLDFKTFPDEISDHLALGLEI